MEKKYKKRILTGDRPTGKLHIGHYLGSLKKRVELQDEYEQFLIIADLQALTDNFNNPEKVRKNVREIVTDYLAAGIDPKKTTIFLQSMIPEIAELTMLYSNLVTVARLQRNPTVKTEMSQKKEIFGNDGESITFGFLGYPVSQAADITAFMGEVVPAGEDQEPLIEQTREIVRKFNSIYGDVLVEPQILLSKNSRVKGLDGNAKMGKSLGNAIYLGDSDDEVRRKIMGAVTDPDKIRIDDKADPDKCMVAYYHKIFSKNYEDICKECKAGKRGCVKCKKELVASFLEDLKDVRERRAYYEKHPEIIDEIIYEGTMKAREVAKETMKKVKEAVRIDYFSDRKE